jgi:hypothetical protein
VPSDVTRPPLPGRAWGKRGPDRRSLRNCDGGLAPRGTPPATDQAAEGVKFGRNRGNGSGTLLHSKTLLRHFGLWVPWNPEKPMNPRSQHPCRVLSIMFQSSSTWGSPRNCRSTAKMGQDCSDGDGFLLPRAKHRAAQVWMDGMGAEPRFRLSFQRRRPSFVPRTSASHTHTLLCATFFLGYLDPVPSFRGIPSMSGRLITKTA